MPKSALFYERTVPVSSEAHQNLSLDPSAGYGFADDVAFVPVTTTEFEKAAWIYPLVFVQEADTVTPCAIMGYRHGENLFVDTDGNWDADYIPACVRRYPFIFATAEAQDSLTLCIDDTYPGLNSDGRGEALFMLGGAKTPYLDGRLAFLQQFQAFIRQLAALGSYAQSINGSLVDTQVNGELTEDAGYEVISLGPLMSLDREFVVRRAWEEATGNFSLYPGY